MKYIVTIQQTRPLTIYFSIYNTQENREVRYVPRLLTPLGYFIRLKILNIVDQIVYESKRPKIKLKLHPSRSESYLALDPGYAYGVVLVLDELDLQKGAYLLQLEYSNIPFTGFPGHPIGELHYEATLQFKVEQ